MRAKGDGHRGRKAAGRWRREVASAIGRLGGRCRMTAGYGRRDGAAGRWRRETEGATGRLGGGVAVAVVGILQAGSCSPDISSICEPSFLHRLSSPNKTAGHCSYISSSNARWVQNSKIVRAKSRITQRNVCAQTARLQLPLPPAPRRPLPLPWPCPRIAATSRFCPPPPSAPRSQPRRLQLAPPSTPLAPCGRPDPPHPGRAAGQTGSTPPPAPRKAACQANRTARGAIVSNM